VKGTRIEQFIANRLGTELFLARNRK